MSKTGRSNYRRGDRESKRHNKSERRVYLRTERRDPPDIELLSKALIALAVAEGNKEKLDERKSVLGEVDDRKEADHDDK